MSTSDLTAATPAPPSIPERTRADNFMRRLLRIGDQVDRNAIFGARRSTTASIVVSGIRCTITYLLIPILTPFIGLLGTVGPVLSIALSVFAIWMGVVGVRRFWLADHRSRWGYTAFIGIVIVLLAVGIGIDVGTIVTA